MLNGVSHVTNIEFGRWETPIGRCDVCMYLQQWIKSLLSKKIYTRTRNSRTPNVGGVITVYIKDIVHICNDNQRLTYNESLSNTVTVIYFCYLTSSWEFSHKLRQFPWTWMKSRPDFNTSSLTHQESDATLQIDDLTISTVQSKPPTSTLPQHLHPPAWEDEKTRLWESISLLNTEKAWHKAIINQSTNRLGPTGISIYSGLARRTAAIRSTEPAPPLFSWN